MNALSSGGCRLLGLTAGLALLATVGGGCAQPDAGGGREASGDSTAHPAPTLEDTGKPADETPRTDLAGEKVVEWTDYEVVTDTQLRFFFPTGTPHCYGSRVAVEEDGTAVRVATIVGTVPDAPENCALVGRVASILVTTETPLEGREVGHLEAAQALPEQP
jgi:hypothetical protein